MFSGNVNCTSNETIGKSRFKSLPGGLTGGLIGGLTGGLIGGLIGGLTGGRTRGGLTGLTGLILSAVNKDRTQVSKKFIIPNNACMMYNSKEKEA